MIVGTFHIVSYYYNSMHVQLASYRPTLICKISATEFQPNFKRIEINISCGFFTFVGQYVADCTLRTRHVSGLLRPLLLPNCGRGDRKRKQRAYLIYFYLFCHSKINRGR